MFTIKSLHNFSDGILLRCSRKRPYQRTNSKGQRNRAFGNVCTKYACGYCVLDVSKIEAEIAVVETKEKVSLQPEVNINTDFCLFVIHSFCSIRPLRSNRQTHFPPLHPARSQIMSTGFRLQLFHVIFHPILRIIPSQPLSSKRFLLSRLGHIAPNVLKLVPSSTTTTSSFLDFFGYIWRLIQPSKFVVFSDSLFVCIINFLFFSRK